jgi:hypothetical protein
LADRGRQLTLWRALQDVTIDTRRQRPLQSRWAVIQGDYHNTSRRERLFDGTGEAQAVGVRQVHVQQNQVGAQPAAHIQTLATVSRLTHDLESAFSPE